jgi:hypothetical protein
MLQNNSKELDEMFMPELIYRDSTATPKKG